MADSKLGTCVGCISPHYENKGAYHELLGYACVNWSEQPAQAEPPVKLICTATVEEMRAAGPVEGISAEQFPLLAKQLSREYNFSSQADRDQAMRMGAELYAAGKSELREQLDAADNANGLMVKEMELEKAKYEGKVGELREERDALKHELGLSLRELSERQKAIERAERAESALREARNKALDEAAGK